MLAPYNSLWHITVRSMIWAPYDSSYKGKTVPHAPVKFELLHKYEHTLTVHKCLLFFKFDCHSQLSMIMDINSAALVHPVFAEDGNLFSICTKIDMFSPSSASWNAAIVVSDDTRNASKREHSHHKCGNSTPTHFHGHIPHATGQVHKYNAIRIREMSMRSSWSWPKIIQQHVRVCGSGEFCSHQLPK